jgi:hypothetical protein
MRSAETSAVCNLMGIMQLSAHTSRYLNNVGEKHENHFAFCRGSPPMELAEIIYNRQGKGAQKYSQARTWKLFIFPANCSQFFCYFL